MSLLLSSRKTFFQAQRVQGVCSAGNKSDLHVLSSIPSALDFHSSKPFSCSPQ